VARPRVPSGAHCRHKPAKARRRRSSKPSCGMRVSRDRAEHFAASWNASMSAYGWGRRGQAMRCSGNVHRDASRNRGIAGRGKVASASTYFESVTALAFEIFARERVDFCGRSGVGWPAGRDKYRDAGGSIITRTISDHENFLGHRAGNRRRKGGHSEACGPAVIAAQQPEVREVLAGPGGGSCRFLPYRRRARRFA